MSKPIIANPEQRHSIDTLLEWLNAPYVADPFYVLDGPAGSGKSYVLSQIARAYEGSAARILNTAPTNKAAKVIRQLTGKAVTTYSALGLRMDASGEVKTLVASEREIDLSDYDVITVDEAGMVNTGLFNHLRQVVMASNLRCILIGDKYQLPPVGERESVIWSRKQRLTLTKVERHDNAILDLVTHIRTQMDTPLMKLTIESKNDGQEGVWKVPKAAFKERLIADAKLGAFSDTNKAKAIAWRNATVAALNDIIRRAIFGPAVGFYEPGERLVAAAPCLRGKEILLSTDDECVVEGIATSRHPMAPEFETVELRCRTDDGAVIRLTVCHPNSIQAYANSLQTLSHQAKADGRQWKRFWAQKELFHEVKYAYAITAHRAQGSTYENVYVDFQDILINRERREALQCLYVAYSRAQKRVITA